jgi:uncharacterized lipoprotein YddW (UPF0748 family)
LIPKSPEIVPGTVWGIKVQSRAVLTPESVDELLDFALAERFNAIWIYSIDPYQGCALWASSLVANFTGSGYDTATYDYLIEEAHRRGIRVYAWLAVGTFASWTDGPSAVLAEHPEWDTNLVTGNGNHWMNFSLPEVRRFIADVVADLAMRHDVDGVHLDYIRYRWGYSEYFGPDDVPMTVQEVYQRLKAVRPETALVGGVLPDYAHSVEFLQSWERWLEEGYIDFVVPMAYCDAPDENDELRDMIGFWESLDCPGQIVPSLSVVNNPGVVADRVPKAPEDLLEQVEICWEFRKGAVFWDNEHVTPEQLEVLRANAP